MNLQSGVYWNTLLRIEQRVMPAYSGWDRVMTEKKYIFKPRGVDCSRNYNVTTDNNNTTFTVSGAELVGKGLDVYLESENTSELILYSVIEG